MLGKKYSSCLSFTILQYWPGLFIALYWIILLFFSYSNTSTEWSQPRLRNQVEEDTEDNGEADNTEENTEIHKHGKIHFKGSLKMRSVICVTSFILLGWGKLNTHTFSRCLFVWLLITEDSFIFPFTLYCFNYSIGQNPFFKSADSSDMPALKSGKTFLIL